MATTRPKSSSFWMDNAISRGTPEHTLIDLGYVRCEAAVDRAKRLREHVGKGNFEIAGFGRLLVRVPPDKVGRILDLFPQIKPASMAPGYSWTTHTWLDPESTALRYAIP
jgi:hypothetical protein